MPIMPNNKQISELVFDERIKCFNEPYAPDELRSVLQDYDHNRKKISLKETRMYSLWLQRKTIVKALPESKGKVLEVGPGGNLTADFMKDLGYEYVTMDAQESVKPDILCDIEDLNVENYDSTFDLVACFQMLEHIPYDSYLETLEKFWKISKKNVLISVPYYYTGPQ